MGKKKKKKNQANENSKVGKLYSGKRKGCRYAMIECYWHGETVDRLARNGASYVIDRGYTLNFPWLVLSWEWAQK